MKIFRIIRIIIILVNFKLWTKIILIIWITNKINFTVRVRYYWVVKKTLVKIKIIIIILKIIVSEKICKKMLKEKEIILYILMVIKIINIKIIILMAEIILLIILIKLIKIKFKIRIAKLA